MYYLPFPLNCDAAVPPSQALYWLYKKELLDAEIQYALTAGLASYLTDRLYKEICALNLLFRLLICTQTDFCG